MLTIILVSLLNGIECPIGLKIHTQYTDMSALLLRCAGRGQADQCPHLSRKRKSFIVNIHTNSFSYILDMLV